MFKLGSFRLSEYEPDYSQNFDTTKYFVVYGATSLSTRIGPPGMLEPLFFKPFPNFVNYNNNRNT